MGYGSGPIVDSKVSVVSSVAPKKESVSQAAVSVDEVIGQVHAAALVANEAAILKTEIDQMESIISGLQAQVRQKQVLLRMARHKAQLPNPPLVPLPAEAPAAK
jgi:predicted hydrolase (HD superfamily)